MISQTNKIIIYIIYLGGKRNSKQMVRLMFLRERLYASDIRYV